MVATTAPIKISPESDDLVSHAAHLLGRSKKDVVERAVREFVDNHRDEINDGVRAALQQLGGTRTSAVAALTGLSAVELEDLGGVPE